MTRIYEYLMAIARVDRLTSRMFCNRRSSEDRLLNRIAET